MISYRSQSSQMSVAKKLGCALILLSIVSVLIWLIIGLTEARDELRDLKTELGNFHLLTLTYY